MDVLEKALLVDELKTLIDRLNDNKTSLFEIAKSKQRIKRYFDEILISFVCFLALKFLYHFSFIDLKSIIRDKKLKP